MNGKRPPSLVERDERSIFVEQFSLGGDAGGRGATVAVKDTIDIAGLPTRAGSRARADVPAAERHAAVVEALLAAGCRIVGKTNLHEFAYGVTGINDWTGTPLNARFPDRIPGGSSSGSAAAVGAGVVDFALGTDTGGSIRVPAACCGVVGMKPTFGRISRRGVMPAATSLDCVGPFAPNVAGIEAALAMLDPGFAVVAEPTDPVLGIVAVDAEGEVAEAVAFAVRATGLRGAPRALPGMQAAFEAGLIIIAAETWAALGEYAESPYLGADVRGLAQRSGSRRPRWRGPTRFGRRSPPRSTPRWLTSTRSCCRPCRFRR